PGPGALHLPAADGGGEPAADPGAAPFEPGGARGPGGAALGGVRPGGPAATAGRPALGRRKAPLRGGPGGGRGAPVPALGRALSGGGPHRGGRAPGADPLPHPAGDRRSHHRPQRPGDPDHHPPGLHHAPGARPGGGHRGGAPGEPRSPPILLGGAVPPVKRLDRYILKELAGSVLFGFGAFTSLFLAAEMVNLASLAADLKAPVGALVRAFLLGIPQILGWTLPMGIMVGSLLTLSRLSANSEIVALQAGGYSLRRVTLPVLALGLAFALIAVGVNEWLAPWANTERERVMVEQVRGRTLPVESRNITLEQYQGGRLSWFLYAARFNPTAQTMQDVTMIRLEDGRPVE